MKKLALVLIAALPLAAFAGVPVTVPTLAAMLCKELPPPAPMFPEPTPLQRALLLLPLPADATLAQAAQTKDLVEVLKMAPMADNTWRSAYMDCDKQEVYVAARGGVIDTTRWYGPYKVAELMSARGDAAPQFQ